MTKTSSRRSSSASLRNRPRAPVHPSSASAGAASSPTPDLSAASANTTGNHRSSASLTKNATKLPSSLPCWTGPTAAGWTPWTTLHVHLLMSFHGCRGGIALFLDGKRCEAVLWDPLTGVQCSVAFPPGLGNHQDNYIWSAAVLCPAGDEQHLHADCHLKPFKLVFVCHDAKHTKASVCIYESMSGVWGDNISTATTNVISWRRPSILVGNALCWLLDGGGILELDLERLALAVIQKPSEAHITDLDVDESFQILRGEDNGLGLAILSESTQSIHLWARRSNHDGVISWELQKTAQHDELVSQSACLEELFLMPGYDEDTNVIFLSSDSRDYILQLESMQFKYIGRREYRTSRIYYHYTNFCTAGGLLVEMELKM